MRRGFTLVELISTIVILALLTATIVVTIPNFINWARETSDKQTLAVLNDALNRYKTQGGDVNALTTGTPIAHVISKLQTAVTWASKSHEFLQAGKTFIGRSIDALGAGHQYRFTRFDHYEAEAGGSSPVASNGPQLGDNGVGYMSNGGAGEIGIFAMATTTGWWASRSAEGIISFHIAANDEAQTTLPTSASYTFWSCASDGDATPAGSITEMQLTMDFMIEPLTEIDFSGLASLNYLLCMGNQLTSLNVSGCTSLQILWCEDNQLSTINAAGCTGLLSLRCMNNNLGTINITGCSSLPAPSSNNSTEFRIQNNPSVNIIGP